MSFTTVGFLVFLPVTALIYYLAPRKAQNAVLVCASLVFYWLNLPNGGFLGKNITPLVLLIASAAFVFYIAQGLRKADKGNKALCIVGVISLIAVLAIFKYSGLLIPVLFGPSSLIKLGFPLGISFYTFRSISYIVDVYRGDIKPEKNLLNYIAYVSFFGSISSGPISRASSVLPQLENTRVFSADCCTSALQMALIGFFKQLAVANIIGLSVNIIFESSEIYGGATLMIAALLYSFQLYFEFSGYSDIAVAVGKIFGIELMQNFKTPYFSTNFSAFWSRWHISLSSWLQDYIFMPLVWGRWTSHIPVIGKKVENPPMISSVIILFFVSGIWHGNTLCFVIWGVLMGLYRAGEELLHKYYKKPKKKPALLLRIFKTSSVFILWSVGLVFFRMGNVEDGAYKAVVMFRNMFSKLFTSNAGADFSAAIQSGFYPKAGMVPIYIIFVLIVLVLALFMDWYQCFKLKDAHISTVFTKMPVLWRWVSYYALIGAVMLSYIMQSGGYGGAVSSPYAGF